MIALRAQLWKATSQPKKTWQITSNVTSLSRIILTFHLAFTRTTSTGPKHRKPCCFDSTFFKEPQGAKSRVVWVFCWAMFHLRENDLKKVKFYWWVIFHYDCWIIFYDYVEDQIFIIIENQNLLMMTLLIHRHKNHRLNMFRNKLLYCTTIESHIAPENQWLKMQCTFVVTNFRGRAISFWEGKSSRCCHDPHPSTRPPKKRPPAMPISSFHFSPSIAINSEGADET